MEDPRLSRMYWKLFREGLERSFSRRRRAGTLRAGGIGLFLILVLGLTIRDCNQNRENDPKPRSAALTSPQKEGEPYRAGYSEPIVLSRSASVGDPAPEFLSVTLLPGQGMDVLQITANLPGQGEVKLLAAGGPAEAAGKMTGTDGDGTGEASLERGGSFLVPWAGRLGGARSVDGKSMAIEWGGRRYWVPLHVKPTEAPSSYGGLLRTMAASSVDVTRISDGGKATATFHLGGLDERWPSETRTTISTLLGSKALDLSVEVSNTGLEATPVGVGWAPRFAILSGRRETARLRVPASMREVMGQGNGTTPTGELEGVKGSAYDFNAPGGVELGSYGLDDTFTSLNTAFDAHPSIELRDPAARIGLRISALSPTIKAVHVFSPPKSGFITISPQMNDDDPFGSEWKMSEDTGMVVLQPGQTVEWKVRVELFAVLPGFVEAQ